MVNRMMEKEPLTIQPVLSSFCNRKCGYCAIKILDLSYYNKDNGYLSIDLAEKMSKEVGSWLDYGIRFELGGFGEPLLNKNTPKIISIFRKYNPQSQIMLYTNQINLTVDLVKELFDSGTNILFLDSYEKKDLEFAQSLKKPNTDYIFYDYDKSRKEFNPYRRSYVDKKIICNQDYTEPEAGNYNKRTKIVYNYADNIEDEAYEKYGIERIYEPQSRICTRPFRDLLIASDGIVPLCCFDWRREMIIGKFPEQSLQEIWESNLMDAIRLRLLSKKRNFIPCSRCNIRSTRTGLVYKPKKTDINLNLEKLMKISDEKFKSYKLKRIDGKHSRLALKKVWEYF